MPRATVARFFPYSSRYELDYARREASNAVSAAIRAGIIKRTPCQECGRKTVEAHHDDYREPLQVRFLCRKHHRAWHREHGGPAIGLQRGLKAPKIWRRRKVAHIQLCKAEGLIGDVTRQIVDVCRREGVSDTVLARRLGVTRQSLSVMFAGGVRTLKALNALTAALGYSVHVELRCVTSDSEVA